MFLDECASALKRIVCIANPATRSVQSAIGAKAVRPRPVGKNALHWAMVEGLQSEQK